MKAFRLAVGTVVGTGIMVATYAGYLKFLKLQNARMRAKMADSGTNEHEKELFIGS